MTRWARRARLGLVVATLGVVGCAPTPVELDVRFPSEQSFLLSDRGRLLVYPVDPDTGLGRCPELVEAAASGEYGQPEFDSGQTPICRFRDPGVGFDSVTGGPHAYVVVALRDEPQATLLVGCRIAEAYIDAPSVAVTLFPTRMYDGAVGGMMSGCTLESKCNGSCQ
ncbi:MAG: hypothetical protein AB7S26_26435 [Sandaracinaceae bacterium]